MSIKWTKSPRPHSRSHHRGAARHCGNHNPFRLPAHRVAMKTMANSEAIAVRLQKICMAQKQCRQKSSISGDDDRCAPDHRVERLEGLLSAGRKFRDPFDQEFQVALDRTEIGVLGIRSSIEGVVIVSHAIDRARLGFMGS